MDAYAALKSSTVSRVVVKLLVEPRFQLVGRTLRPDTAGQPGAAAPPMS